MTLNWPVRVFTFLLAVTEVNMFLACRYFLWKNEKGKTLLQFRKMLAKALIFNTYLVSEEEKEKAAQLLHNKRRKVNHTLETAPQHARKFDRTEWVCDNKWPFQQYRCSTHCGKQTRTYCSCDVGVWLCKDCHLKHVIERVSQV